MNTPELIKQSAVDYFTNHFAGDSVVLQPPTLTFPGMAAVTLEQNSELCNLPSMEELHNVVKVLKPDSASGPDGFTGKFFQRAWQVIKYDLLERVIDFFSREYSACGFLSFSSCFYP